MKKVLGLIVLAMMVVLPMKTNAAEFSAYMECPTQSDGKTLNVDWTDSQKLTGTVTCTVKADLTSGASLNTITISLIPGDMNIVSVASVTGSGTWAGNSTLNSTKGQYDIVFGSTQSYSGSVITVGTVVVNVKKARQDDNCNFTYQVCTTVNGDQVCGDKTVVEENNTCKIVNGKYYGLNGTEVTEEVYNAECVSNPQTGNFVPYMVIVAGIVLAVGVFTISRKNTKLYKI